YDFAEKVLGKKMGNIRSFIAVGIAPVICSAAHKQIRELQKSTTGYRWVDTKNMHLTLKFLGNVLDREIPDVCRTIERAMKGQSIFDIGFRGIGAFPSVDRPRVLWMGIEDYEGRFAELSRKLDAALAEMGFQPEKRDFKAHLTLGRAEEVPQPSQALADYFTKNADVEFGSMEIDEIVLFSSFTDKYGTTHTPMATIELE
ncbi:MAG: RNA 2',3'-cyclic phosphodiesterase, partial [Pirellulaceae bacterium]